MFRIISGKSIFAISSIIALIVIQLGNYWWERTNTMVDTENYSK